MSKNIYIKIQGELDSAALFDYDKNKHFEKFKKDGSVLILLVDYSEFEIWVGQQFNFIQVPKGPVLETKTELLMVSIFAKSIDVLSEGHKAVIALKFYGVINPYIFPKVNKYGENTRFIYISTQIMGNI